MRALPPIALGLSLGFACGGTGSTLPAIDLQMNDLSVLLPLPRDQTELDMALAPSAQAQGGPLFPEALYDAGGGGGGYTDLRVAAFRLDPCFGQLGAIASPSKCQAQLRVVFQPMVATSDNSVIAPDMGVHAFYALSDAQLVDAVTDMIDAREDDHGSADLGPLAVHPVVAQEGLTGPLAQRFDAIILKYAGAANLIRFTTLELELPNLAAPDGDGDGGGVWQLESFDVGSGSATRRTIATLAGSATTMSFEVATNPLSADFSPMTTSTDDISLLVNYTQAAAASTDALQAAYDSALRIENPRDNSPDTIDCASCHMAEPGRVLVGEPLGMTASGDANAFVPDAAIPLADLAQTTDILGSDGTLNIHAFSYVRAEPVINQRVIHETAANLTYIAALLQ
jgi:hypothetical protein